MVIHHMLAMGAGSPAFEREPPNREPTGPHRHLGKRALCHRGASRNANELQEHVRVPG